MRDNEGNARRMLVTGGLGFIGFHLCSELLRLYPNCKLTIVDNLSSTRLDFRSLQQRSNIHLCDLRDFRPPAEAFDDVFHLASPVGSLGILGKHGHIATDILELAHIASNLADRSAAKLLYLSSSEVYGRDGQHGEHAELIVPNRHGTRMEYALGKLTAEHVLVNLADSGSHTLRIVRPFNVVGPFQSAELGFVIPAFFNSALSGTPLLVHGDGKQTRSFCDVRDLVTGLLAVHEHGKPGETYNVGNPYNETSIEALAQEIATLCNSRSAIEHIDPQARYGNHYLEAYNKMPVIHKVEAHTGWRPVTRLDEVLERLLAFHRRTLPGNTEPGCEHHAVAHIA